MSATTHSLLEQLEALQIEVNIRDLKGEDTTDLMQKIVALKERLLKASFALNEGKQILKG
jgi:hypothetical protein